MLLLMVITTFAVHIYIFHFVLDFGWSISLQDGAYSSVILYITIWGIMLLIKAYPTSAAIFLYALFVALAASAAATAAEYEIIKWWTTGHNELYYQWLRQSLPIRFIFIWIFNSWIATNVAMRKTLTAQDARFQLQADASVLLKEAELFKLRQQLQPHFLYNSLNSISALIILAPDKAQEMIGKLSDFLRSSVKRESEDVLPITDELNYIQTYLAIESVRFGDRLQIHIEQEQTEGATIPPFLLQPILENAIKFGLYGKTGEVSIWIYISLEPGMLRITVSNPYDADMQPPKGTGFGLQGISRRLYLLYGRTDLLQTISDGKSFTTTLQIPQNYVQSHTN